jgi:hypothetical protein
MRVVAYQNGAGVSIIYPAPGFEAEAVLKDVPDGAPFAILDTATLPDKATRDRWTWDNGAIAVGPAVTVQTTQITFAQLLIGLVTEGWISEAEGEAWLTGTPPAPVLTLIGQLPQAARFAARARALRPSIVLLSDPLVQALGAMQGKTAELPAFFNTYGAA